MAAVEFNSWVWSGKERKRSLSLKILHSRVTLGTGKTPLPKEQARGITLLAEGAVCGIASLQSSQKSLDK